ncbi:MAG: ankyrin repeat domain-containing protein [Desulfobacterales bacterium]|nr:ankyrin repeat domain-containing protein [Desulfobacterales bacterium]
MGKIFTIDFTADAGNTYQPRFVLYNIERGYKSVSYQSNAWIQNRTRYNRALSYYNQGQYEKAILVCDKSLENSYCPGTHILRACCYHEVEKYKKAISDFNESIKISPELFRVYENRGMAYFKLENYSQALSDYNTAMNFRPENLDRPNIPYAKYDDKSKETLFRLFMLRADAYLHMGNREKAYLDLKQAADLNNIKCTRLNFSLQRNQAEIAKHLINSGADINAKDKKGWTPLMFALRYNQPDNAKELINRGADVNPKNSDGWTPLMFASRYNQIPNANELVYKEIISILKKAAAT